MSFLALNAVAAALPALVLLPLAKRYDVVKRALRVPGRRWPLASPASTCSRSRRWCCTLLMAVMGIGWAAIVSLPFSIMSQRVDQSRIGLYMGVFNLSIVLPQLVVSLGVGTFVSGAQDKGAIFLIGAVSLALSAIAWRSVAGEDRATVGTAVEVRVALEFPACPHAYQRGVAPRRESCGLHHTLAHPRAQGLSRSTARV